MTRPTGRLRRDTVAVLACAVFIVGSLLVARLLASSPDTPAQRLAAAPQATQETAMVTATPAAATASDAAPDSSTSVTVLQGAVRTVQLVAGQTVTPRPVAPRAAAAAPTTALPATMPAASVPTVDTAENTAIAWITLLCTYDWQTDPSDHQGKAQTLGDVTFPADADPFTFTDQGWAQIVRTHQSSTCVDTAVTVEQAPTDHPGAPTVRIATTQILAADRKPFQQTPLTMTRALQQTASGWQVGPPITAN